MYGFNADLTSTSVWPLESWVEWMQDHEFYTECTRKRTKNLDTEWRRLWKRTLGEVRQPYDLMELFNLLHDTYGVSRMWMRGDLDVLEFQRREGIMESMQYYWDCIRPFMTLRLLRWLKVQAVHKIDDVWWRDIYPGDVNGCDKQWRCG